MLGALVNKLSAKQKEIVIIILSLLSPIIAFSDAYYPGGNQAPESHYYFVGTLWLYRMDRWYLEPGLYFFFSDMISSAAIFMLGFPSLIFSYYVIKNIQDGSKKNITYALGILTLLLPTFVGIMNTGSGMFLSGYFVYTGPVSLLHLIGFIFTKYGTINEKKWLE